MEHYKIIFDKMQSIVEDSDYYNVDVNFNELEEINELRNFVNQIEESKSTTYTTS